MDKITAQHLIEKTFNESFSENQFTLFTKNLLNDLEQGEKVRSYSGNYIWDDFKEHINTYKRIGKYIDPNGEAMDVLIVEVKSIAKLERARTALRNFVIKHLSRFSKDYALVAFYSKEDRGAEWRFSFIKLEYQSVLDEEKGKVKTRTEFTPAKRYSFLVGKYEKTHTAKNQLLPLLQNITNNPTIEELEAAFSIEKVTDEFFNQYKDLYIKLYEHLENDNRVMAEFENAGINNARFTKKLLGQIVFLYFLQKKGWLGVAQNARWGTGKKRFVQELFELAQSEKLNFFKDKLQYLFYEALAKERDNVNSYYKRFDCRIPFLNGGLFEADYNWREANISIPEDLFRNVEKNKSGDVGTGILDVFDRYNFTIKEDEPLDKEVAVDPEMLGKVFENMLDITERKSKGAFYTPREIVHYMCQESLIHYLDNSLNSGTNNFQELGSNQTKLFSDVETKKGQVSIEIEHGKQILVPQKDIELFIRKGHFALENDERVATKGETKTYQYQLPESIRKNADLIDKELSSIKICDPAIGSGAFPVGLLHELVNAMLVLKPHLSYNYLTDKLKGFGFTQLESVSDSRYIYRLKRHIIQESIYGVDIDSSAIDIARLRLWLSLVVDEDDLDPIETLPNLDYKIVCGNSLIGLPENVMRNLKVEAELEILKDKFYDITDEKEKKALRQRINAKIRELLDSAETFAGYKIDFDFKLFFSEVWREKGGFDVVIGNPPYVLLQDKYDDKIALKFFKSNYSIASYKIDLYHLFFEKACNLKNHYGSVIYITPTNYQSNNYSKDLRKHLLKNNLNHIVVLEGSIFKASVNTSITHLILKQDQKVKFDKAILNSHNNLTINEVAEVPFSFFETDDILFIPPLNKDAARILEIITRKNNKSLKSISEINFGMQLRNRKHHPLDVLQNPDLSILTKYYKKCYTGKDIKSFVINYSNRYCYYNREAKRGGCWNDDAQFAKNKILIPQIGKYPIGAIDRLGYPVLNTAFMINIFSSDTPESILAQINSEVVAFFWINKFRDDRDAFPKIKGSYLRCLPIKNGNNKIDILVKYVELIGHKSDIEIAKVFFVSLINSLIYELYFPDEIKAAGKEILKHLGDLKPITDEMSEEKKLAIIQSEYERLSHPNHPVRIAIETLDSVEEVRIIREALK